MDIEVIDFVLQKLVQRDILPGVPSWQLLKDHLVQSCMMTPERIEVHQAEIIKRFIRLRKEQTEQAHNELLGTNAQRATSTPIDEGYRSLKTSESTRSSPEADGSNSGSSSDKESSDEEGFQLTIDEDLTEERSNFMSIYLSSNGRWGGAALKYCQEAESFVNPKIIERHRLKTADDGRIRLTWRLSDEQESNMTQFIVVEGLSCDIILGTKCCDEKFNREESPADYRKEESATSSSNSSAEPLEPPLPHMNPYVGQTGPNMENLITMAARINLTTAALLTYGQPLHESAVIDRQSYPLQQRNLPVEEVRGSPSATRYSSGRDRRSKKRTSTVDSMGADSTGRHDTRP